MFMTTAWSNSLRHRMGLCNKSINFFIAVEMFGNMYQAKLLTQQ